jgi:hypothetical protein
MRMPDDPISETALLRLMRAQRRIALREAGDTVVDLMVHREARAMREALALSTEQRPAAGRDSNRPACTDTNGD